MKYYTQNQKSKKAYSEKSFHPIKDIKFVSVKLIDCTQKIRNSRTGIKELRLIEEYLKTTRFLIDRAQKWSQKHFQATGTFSHYTILKGKYDELDLLAERAQGELQDRASLQRSFAKDK